MLHDQRYINLIRGIYGGGVNKIVSGPSVYYSHTRVIMHVIKLHDQSYINLIRSIYGGGVMTILSDPTDTLVIRVIRHIIKLHDLCYINLSKGMYVGCARPTVPDLTVHCSHRCYICS